MSPAPPAAPPPRTPARVTVVGIGADGWDGLPAASQEALRGAGTLVGGVRQLALLPAECAGERVAWPSPLRPAVPGLLAAHAGREVCVLASGDPMFYGIGRTLAEVLGEAGAAPPRVLPHPSSVSYACARLGWPVEDTEVVTLVGRPLAGLAAALHDGRRLLVLSAGAATPAQVAGLLRERGFGPTRMRVLEQLGGPRERQAESTAADWPSPPAAHGTAPPAADGTGPLDATGPPLDFTDPLDSAAPLNAIDPLNVVALDCARDPEALRLSAAPGLPDAAYEHDGQLTKRHVRAATLAALAPAPGELLWDIGGGSGSIGIEWMRTHRTCRAVAVERDAVRAGRITRNADALGVPALRVVTGPAPEALAGLPVPHAVFIGGGLTAPGLLEACWAALPPGGRLVANTVTLESEALLADWYRRHGGDLVRLAVAHAVPVGGFTGWRQAMPVTQWSATKPRAAASTASTASPASPTPDAPSAPGDAQ
ncbi:precorrin-6Y methyltransferase [Streptomyces sp. CB02923]|uniref:precorrin-6y C5,15-methyltransferase (decarboxylating) subunit CbiE n=1 Tax=Streptomyces sp. CB02923 TaxID=1718985 RepID=UPI00093A2B04|nr:precorrin-6y C5,15-methyltransferase (decarboxylating) subunit CbiE [Streptomyces sp. CB02923]OKI00219.1 precorrin-6Y methyltransferase [Streptomyces sp. CB02923]